MKEKKLYFTYFKGRVTALVRQAERNDNGRYNLNDVIDWFLARDSMSPKKLQKLLYYAYAWTLTLENDEAGRLDSKLFEEKFEAWVHGPVIPEVYHRFKDRGYNEIDKIKIDYTPVFDEDIEDVLNQVWNEYGHYTGNQLENITHQENPWREARGDRSPLERCNTEITDENIFNYYIQQVEYE